MRGQRAYWGGQLAHVGVAAVAVVIAVSGGLASRDSALTPGESMNYAGYSVTFETSEEHVQPDRVISDAHLAFRTGDGVEFVATPQPVTAAATSGKAGGNA